MSLQKRDIYNIPYFEFETPLQQINDVHKLTNDNENKIALISPQ